MAKISLKIIQAIKKEIADQKKLSKLLEQQEKNYGSNFKKEKENIAASLETYENILKIEEGEL